MSSLQRIVALMEADDVEAGPILTTGPLDATPEKTEAFLDSSPATTTFEEAPPHDDTTPDRAQHYCRQNHLC